MAREPPQADTPKARAFSLARFNPSEMRWVYQDITWIFIS